MYKILKEKIKLLLQEYPLIIKNIDVASIFSILDEIKLSDLSVAEKIDVLKYSFFNEEHPSSLIHLIFLSHHEAVINSFYNLILCLNRQGISYNDIAEKMFFKNPGRILNALVNSANKDELYVYLCALKRIYQPSAVNKDLFRDYLMFPCISFKEWRFSLFDFIRESKNQNYIYALVNSNILRSKDYLLLQDNVNSVYQVIEEMIERLNASKNKKEIGFSIIDMLTNHQNPFYLFFSLGQPNNPILLKLTGLVSKLDMDKELAMAYAACDLDIDDSIGADSCISSEADSVSSFESDSDLDERDIDVNTPLLSNVRVSVNAVPKQTTWNRLHNSFVSIFSPSVQERNASAQANFGGFDSRKDDDKNLPFYDRL